MEARILARPTLRTYGIEVIYGKDDKEFYYLHTPSGLYKLTLIAGDRDKERVEMEMLDNAIRKTFTIVT